MDTLVITRLILGGTIIANVLLIIFVVSQNIRPLMNKVLITQMLGILGWVVFIFINLWLESERVERLIFAFAATALMAQLHFVVLYPGSQLPKKLQYLMSFAFGFGSMFVIASFIPNAVFSSIEVTRGGYTILSPGWFSGVYALFVFVYIMLAIIVLAYKRHTLPTEQLRNQTKYLFYGFVAFLITNLLTNSILPVVFHVHFFNAIGPIFSLILVAFIIHNIFRYKFLEIQSLIQRGLIYLFLLGSVVTLYLGLVALIGHIAQPTLQMTAFTAGTITTLIGIFTVPSIDYHLRRLTHPLFFKGQFDYSVTLYELSQVLHETLSVQTIIDTTTDKLARLFGADIMINTNNNQSPSTTEGVLSFVLSTSNGKIGELLLGAKQSGDAYTRRDEQMLSTLTNQVAIAIERAQLYEAVREYSEKLEAKVADRTSELEALQRYQKQMLDELSHGLKIPLTIIMSEFEVLKLEATTTSMFTFKKSVDRLAEFINKLLLLSQLEADDNPWQYSLFDFSALLSEVVEYSEISLHRPDVSFSHTILPHVYVMWDKKRLAEVMHILLHNASKYRDPHRHQKVSIGLAYENDTAVVTVHDTGLGIAPLHQPHIFKRFYRIRDNVHSDIEGSGLGLSIAETIIQKHHGTINVKSEEGYYTEFTIKLPGAYVLLHKT